MPDETPPPAPGLSGRRVIVYGAETDAGRAIAEALRAAGASIGVCSNATEGAALFALKRAAAGAPAESVDVTNPTNVRVATRKLAKALGGLDIAVVLPPRDLPREALDAVLEIAVRELGRADDPSLVLITATARADLPARIRDVPVQQLEMTTPTDAAEGFLRVALT